MLHFSVILSFPSAVEARLPEQEIPATNPDTPAPLHADRTVFGYSLCGISFQKTAPFWGSLFDRIPRDAEMQHTVISSEPGDGGIARQT